MDTTVTGVEISLEDILEARDHRCTLQRELLEKHETPLISFTLNIAGPVKVFPLTIRAFEEGLRLITQICEAEGISLGEPLILRQATGYEALMPAEADALHIKRLMTELEEQQALGRLFDIDVIRTDGSKVSRTEIDFPERSCLICGETAAVCARSRAHSLPELLERSCTIMREYFIEQHADLCADVAVKALLYEVTVTPKPGLVDRDNTGAHADMDIFSFIDSAVSLRSYFREVTAMGSRGCSLPLEELFGSIRPVGKAAEVTMFKATAGINTHKGLIFSLGIICCAAGRLFMHPEGYSREDLAAVCAGMTIGLMDDFKDTSTSTAGKRCYHTYGLTGIRGEASQGFPAVMETALPILQESLSSGLSLNDACVRTLVAIMAKVVDTNIISRSDKERMLQTQEEMQSLMDSPTYDSDELLQTVKEFDTVYIKEHISPGGSADILALTIFLQFYEEAVTT